MNVLLASDNTYAPLLGVTLYSFLENNKKDFKKINIFILDNGITNESKIKLQHICDEFDVPVSLSFIEIINIEEKLGIKIKSTLSLAAYLRLFVASLLDDSIDKVLYLDCDALVMGSFIDLWNTDLKDNYCGQF